MAAASFSMPTLNTRRRSGARAQVNAERHRFDENPHWEGLNNRRSYTTCDVRPWFDFGFSPTHFAGGKGSGELGGLIFRGDGRFAGMMAFYGDRLDALNLGRPLRV